MPQSIFLLLPACSITFVLCLMFWAVARAAYKHSRIYTTACLIMSVVCFTDTLLHGCGLLAFRFNSLNTLSHALLAIPFLSVEIFLISTGALILFHRKYHAKLLLLTGFTPSVLLLCYSLILSITNIPKYENWPAALNAIMTDYNGHMLLYLSLFFFGINAIGSIAAMIRSLLRYRRQINSYFGFHDVIRTNILTCGTCIYIAFIIVISLHLANYIHIKVFADAITIHCAAIVCKICFFTYVCLLVIRYHERYYSIEPALDVIDTIDRQVENRTRNTFVKKAKGETEKPENAQTHDELHVHALSNELDSRLKQWTNDPKKFYLRDGINVLQLAEMLKVKPRLLSDYLNTVMGVNFNQYINSLRIEEAKRMILEDKNRTFNDIAVYTGFSSSATFCKTFKRITGITPTQFKKQLGNN